MTDDATSADRRALLQNAMRALDDMQAKLDRVDDDAHEPIAIVGMSCRFPGGANSPEEYWDVLHEGRDVVGVYPDDRRAMASAAGIDIDMLGDRAWYGGFLDQIDHFDPQFFGI
jgi:acyl transferase domain-containing protein